jgi:hypothetical protein
MIRDGLISPSLFPAQAERTITYNHALYLVSAKEEAAFCCAKNIVPANKPRRSPVAVDH